MDIAAKAFLQSQKAVGYFEVMRIKIGNQYLPPVEKTTHPKAEKNIEGACVIFFAGKLMDIYRSFQNKKLTGSDD